ncbi:MAG: hypothetical protein HY735_38735 [Verrucomicrobia bacterium]|nr:hypothetical protein [Verrucomicrobiota bacterium]
MVPRRKILLGIGLAFIAVVMLFVTYRYLFVPLKFRYLIYRVESARTADEERRAFRIAADWGRVWEADRIRPEDAIAVGRMMTGDWLLRLEWLDSSPFNGGAYVAYRAVMDTNNLRILWDRSY